MLASRNGDICASPQSSLSQQTGSPGHGATVAEASERSCSTARHLRTVAAKPFQLKTYVVYLWVEASNRCRKVIAHPLTAKHRLIGGNNWRLRHVAGADFTVERKVSLCRLFMQLRGRYQEPCGSLRIKKFVPHAATCSMRCTTRKKERHVRSYMFSDLLKGT